MTESGPILPGYDLLINIGTDSTTWGRRRTSLGTTLQKCYWNLGWPWTALLSSIVVPTCPPAWLVFGRYLHIRRMVCGRARMSDKKDRSSSESRVFGGRMRLVPYGLKDSSNSSRIIFSPRPILSRWTPKQRSVQNETFRFGICIEA